MMALISLILSLPYSSFRPFYLAYKQYVREWILERDIRDRCTLLQFYYQSAPRAVKRIIMNRSAGAQTSVGSIAQQLGTNNALHASNTNTSSQYKDKTKRKKEHM
jgi:hypothetical protein